MKKIIIWLIFLLINENETELKQYFDINFIFFREINEKNDCNERNDVDIHKIRRNTICNKI